MSVKRRDLEKHLRDAGCVLHHHGGKHDIWTNPQTGAQSPVPRHPEIKRWTARGICRILGVRAPTWL